MNGSDPRLSARELLEEAHPALVGLSHWIHANPEVGFQETLASGWVAEWLVTAGFEVETPAGGMPTAVIGRTGPGPFHVAICVEYDALPEVGHACGHNVIAAAGVGAGLALASVAEELGLRISVLGTPAEETGGGKLRLIEAGAFEGVHAAMMVHPWPTDVAEPPIIAVNQLEVAYIGREAHAAGFPQRGLNAGDALVVAQTAIGLLRQQLLPTDRVHGIVTRGGDAPNIIPAHTTALYMVRAHDRARMEELTRLVTRCFEAGALATGTELTIVEGTAYSNMLHDPDLAALYRHNAELLGRVFDDSDGAPVSTDMGNVSHLVPSIHPMIGIDTNGAVNHQQAFADACATPSADQAILDGAVAMSWTVIDAAQDAVLRARLIREAVAREAGAPVVPSDDAGPGDQATILAEEAAALSGEADALADGADAFVAAALVDTEGSQELADEAAQLSDEAAGLATAATVYADAADDEALEAVVLTQEADSLEGTAANLAVGAWTFADASEAAFDDVADDAAVALEATGEAAEMASVADALATEAAELASQSSELAAEADTLAQEAVAVAVADPDEAELLADSAFQFETQAAETAGEAQATFEQALEAEAEAQAADDLAEVATEAAEDAQDDAVVDAVLAEALADEAVETDDLAEVVAEAADDAAAAAIEDEAVAEALAEEAIETDDLAEVVAEAADDAAGAAVADVITADALAGEAARTHDLAEVVLEAVEDAQAETSPTAPSPGSSPVPGSGHADWEEQFQTISAHAAWELEYARMTGAEGGPPPAAGEPAAPAVMHLDDATAVVEGTAEPAAPADEREDVGATNEEILASVMSGMPDAAPVGAEPAAADDGWYSGAPELETPETGASGEPEPETPLGGFEWIPANPESEP